MFIFNIRWSLAATLWAAGCASHSPSSLRPGIYSTTTAAPIKISVYEEALNPAPFPDYDAIQYRIQPTNCRDTFHLADLSAAGYNNTGTPSMPGTLLCSPNGLTVDETEIPNSEWRLFVAASVAKGVLEEVVVPDKNALPVPDYYSSPFYAYYPVVGISYEQAQKFCAWRTELVNEQLGRATPHLGVVCEYRLPTEAEWEESAAAASGLPYGSICLKRPIVVATKAAHYLKKRSNSTASISQIEKDIADFNKTRPVRSWINCAQQEPYFLGLASPGYCYQGPPNYFGLYQMLGNASEMVAERGITKGGSYLDDVKDCRIKARGRYDRPLPNVGFRCVCTVKRVK